MNANPCPVAPLAAEMAELVAAEHRLDEATSGLAGAALARANKRLEAVQHRRDAVETLAGQHRAASAEGALLQLAIAHGLVDAADCTGGIDDAWVRTIRGCLHSVAALVEAQSGVAREAVGGDFYMSRRLDPHLLMDEALDAAA